MKEIGFKQERQISIIKHDWELKIPFTGVGVTKKGARDFTCETKRT